MKERFAERLAHNGGVLLDCRNQAGAVESIHTLVSREAAARGGRVTVFVSPSVDEKFDPRFRGNLKSRILSGGVDATVANELTADAIIGVSAADAVLVDDGAVVVEGPAAEQAATLLPEISVILMNAPAAHRDLHSYFSTRRSGADAMADIVVISGPSRTADIEKRVVPGMHGPEKLFVILV